MSLKNVIKASLFGLFILLSAPHVRSTSAHEVDHIALPERYGMLKVADVYGASGAAVDSSYAAGGDAMLQERDGLCLSNAIEQSGDASDLSDKYFSIVKKEYSSEPDYYNYNDDELLKRLDVECFYSVSFTDIVEIVGKKEHNYNYLISYYFYIDQIYTLSLSNKSGCEYFVGGADFSPMSIDNYASYIAMSIYDKMYSIGKFCGHDNVDELYYLKSKYDNCLDSVRCSIKGGVAGYKEAYVGAVNELNLKNSTKH